MRQAWLLAASVGALAACGGDDESTGGFEPVSGAPSLLAVIDVWAFSGTDVWFLDGDDKLLPVVGNESAGPIPHSEGADGGGHVGEFAEDEDSPGESPELVCVG